VLSDNDDLVGFAVVRAIEIVGEAARHVTQETRDLLPQIPWTKIAGMCNRIAHNYLDVDYKIVWDVATVELPNLINELEKIIADE
jgi:uncharacterized protein with HEPN domain